MHIEHFIVMHKVERIKELIMYDELTISEIAWKMNYSSLAHLSNQFKKVTGLYPSDFKNLKDKRRSLIEEIGNEKTCSAIKTLHVSNVKSRVFTPIYLGNLRFSNFYKH